MAQNYYFLLYACINFFSGLEINLHLQLKQLPPVLSFFSYKGSSQIFLLSRESKEQEESLLVFSENCNSSHGF